jgi:hypothetical protein
MVTYGGEQSLDRYLALSARGIPFNVAHALGNIAIALAAGPALVRMISRFKSRLEFEWRPASAAPLAAVALVAVLGGAAVRPVAAEAATAAGWLAASQSHDGGFGAARGQPSSPAMTGWAMLGLEAAGRNPLDLRQGGSTPVSYLREEIDRLRSVGDLERTILALDGAGLDPHRFAGRDLVAELRDRRSADGSVDGQVNLTAFYVLALRSAGVDPGRLGRAARWLRSAQNRNGGWGIQPRAPSEADSTGAALQALAAARAEKKAIAEGARFLRRSQARGGGFALAGTGVVNAQSTAWAIQGLVASGSPGGAIRDALGYLGSLREPDGHYRYSASSDQTPVWVTAQALLAVERQALPLEAVARAPRQTEQAVEPQPAQQPETAPGTEGSNQPSVSSKPHRQESPDRPAKEPVDSDTKTVAESTGSEPTVLNAPATPEPAADHGLEDNDSSDTAPYVFGGLGALAAVLAAGFLWYRRRLP